MKKFLLSAAALVAAMSANAQVFKVSAEAHGITEGTLIAAGYEWGKIEGAATITNAYETQHKALDNKNNDFTKVIIDGNEFATSDGVQGNDNPKDEDGGNPALTLKPAVSGAVIQIDAQKDGWVYIVAKLSTNKQYMVFEEGLPIGYKIAMENTDERIQGGVLNLEIKGEGEYNNIPEGRQVQWVIREYLNDVEAATAGNGLGVFYFPVAKDCKYLAHATGSKIMWSGIYFSENEAQSVIVEGDGISKTLIGEGGGAAAGSFQVSAEANGITEGTLIAAGYEWGKIDDALTITNAFETNHKAVDNANNDFTKVVIDGTEFATSDGVQGNDNPKDEDGGNPALTLKPAVSGAVIQIDAQKDGWVYIVAKLSTNKQYMVFEEGLPIGYKIAMENTDERIQGGVLNLEIKGEGEYNNIPEGRQIQWVIREYLNDVEAATAGNGLGVFYFPVAKDCRYLAHATGSKIMWNGIYFSEKEAKTVKVEGDGISKTIVGATTGINPVSLKKVDDAIYNLAGQKVNASYKGVVIMNGKKMIQK